MRVEHIPDSHISHIAKALIALAEGQGVASPNLLDPNDIAELAHGLFLYAQTLKDPAAAEKLAIFSHSIAALAGESDDEKEFLAKLVPFSSSEDSGVPDPSLVPPPTDTSPTPDSTTPSPPVE